MSVSMIEAVNTRISCREYSHQAVEADKIARLSEHLKSNTDVPFSKASAGSYATPLECVPIGPSASNKQPWRIIKDGVRFHFYVKRTPGYDRYFGPVRLQTWASPCAILIWHQEKWGCMASGQSTIRKTRAVKWNSL